MTEESPTLLAKQVDEMKTIIMLSVILSLAATPILAEVLNDHWMKPEPLYTNECQWNQYACIRPQVSFAFLR
ncbi:MAG: hypothetical protein JWP80_2745 [Pseudomonas sp.]|nr:hypothetical protein [Pseudomonas sp.]